MNGRRFFQELGKQIYRMDAMYANYAKRLNLKSTTILWVLYALDDGTDHSQKEISMNWHIPKSSVNAAISELDEQGFVTFLPIQGEKRELLVRLTPAGQEYAHKMLAELYEIERRAYESFSPDTVTATAALEDINHKLREAGMPCACICSCKND